MVVFSSVLDLLPVPRYPVLPGRGLVQRRQLLERLSAAPAGGVIVVSGPPGSGKTVLVSSWLGRPGRAIGSAWVSIERGERDGQRFWLSVIDMSGRRRRAGREGQPGSRPAR